MITVERVYEDAPVVLSREEFSTLDEVLAALEAYGIALTPAQILELTGSMVAGYSFQNSEYLSYGLSGVGVDIIYRIYIE